MSDEPQIFAEDVCRFTFHPGDVAVLTTKHSLSPAVIERIQAFWHQTFPGIKCIVLEESIELSIANIEAAS